VQVWNVATGERLGATVDHPQHVMAAAISPCGRWAASWGGERGDVRLWDAATGTDRARLSDHTDRVQAIEFSPDGGLIATAARDGSVGMFAVPAGARLATLRHSRSVDCLAFDGDGARLLTGSRDLTARLWRLQREADGGLQTRELRVFVGNADHLLAVGFDRQGQLAVTAGKDGIVRIFDAGEHDVATGTELMRYEIGATVEAAAFDPEGRRVLALAGRQRALIWDFGDTRGVSTLRQHGPVPAACFDATGDRVVTAGDDERLRLWNARDGRQLWVTAKLGNPIRTVDVDPSGERIVLGTTDGRVAVHRLGDGELLFALSGHRGRVRVARWVAGGSRILTASDNDAGGDAATLALWNANDHTQVWQWHRPQRLLAADLSPAEPLLATVERQEACVRLWSVPDFTPRGELGQHAGAVTSVQFAADGRTLLTTSLDGTARIHRLDGTVVQTFVAGHPLQAATWSRDGSRVLTCAERGSVEAQLWQVADGQELLRFRGHRGAIASACFSPDASWAVTASSDGTACVWPTDPVAVARRLPLRPLEPAERERHGLLDTAHRK
jgi:WD40 repeat protein